MAWPAVGVVGGGEASAASQPATGGRSTRHDRRWFGRLEQEDQRLKKHYGRWMDIVRSLELESCILTKLTKPSVPVNLVGPQVSLPLYWVPANRGSIHFFVRNKEALPCVRRYSWWVRAVSGGNVFFAKYRGPFPCVRPWTQLSASPRTVHFRCMSVVDHVDQAAPRAPGRWTTARPRKGTTRRQGRLGSCFPRGGEYDCTRVYWFVCRRRRITAGVGE